MATVRMQEAFDTAYFGGLRVLDESDAARLAKLRELEVGHRHREGPLHSHCSGLVWRARGLEVIRADPLLSCHISVRFRFRSPARRLR